MGMRTHVRHVRRYLDHAASSSTEPGTALPATVITNLAAEEPQLIYLTWNRG
jgi:hypothetical protein